MNTPDNESCWIQTYKKHRFNPFNISPDSIDIEDIAHALSQKCRFGGHTSKFYSVAQHSILVYNLTSELNPELQGEALLHDASEAYLEDIPRPIKHHPDFKYYIDLEHSVTEQIFLKFNLKFPIPSEIKIADSKSLWLEANSFMSPFVGNWDRWEMEIDKKWPKIIAMSCKNAEKEFLRIWKSLSGNH